MFVEINELIFILILETLLKFKRNIINRYLYDDVYWIIFMAFLSKKTIDIAEN